MKYLRMKTLLGGMGLLLMVAGLFDVSHAREMEMQELNPLQSQDVKAFGKRGRDSGATPESSMSHRIQSGWAHDHIEF